ncbi:MAG: transporter substrate-binding domain-containing protein [Spirochaetales bacterium]|nr:transporter substrate-binding domain-containing protein [Spirochaetales bacterium]
MKIYASVLLCVFLLLISSPGAAREYLAVSMEFAPFSYTENGTVKGLDSEIVEECFRRMGEDVELILIPWNRALSMGMQGNADCIFNILKTPEREFQLLYSKPLRQEIMTLYVRKDSPLVFNGDLSELKGLRLGLIRDFSYGKKVDIFIKNQVPDSDIEFSVASEMSVAKLTKGRFEVMVGDMISTLGAINRLGVADQVRQLGAPISKNDVYVAFSKKRNLRYLRDRFNVALESMRVDGTLDRIVKKYIE